VDNIVVSVENLTKKFVVYDRPNDSIRDKIFSFSSNNKKTILPIIDVSFKVRKGEFIGVIGPNGAGKSTLLNLILGTIVPSSGKVTTEGRVLRLALALGFDQLLSARENIYINGSILGLSFKEIGRRFDKIIQFASLQKFVDTPIKYFSSGMKTRLAFSIATFSKADILLIDEFFGGVGDEDFKKKSSLVFKERILTGKTVIHVNHNLSVIEEFCDRVILLNEGKLVLIDTPEVAISAYKAIVSQRNT